MSASLFPESVLGSRRAALRKAGTDAARTTKRSALWTLDGEVLIASITAKMHVISPDVTEGLLKAVDLAEKKYQGLVIWSPDDVFSVGADLAGAAAGLHAERRQGASTRRSKKLQRRMLRMRYANVPVVAAVRGMALGGGCEIAVHSAQARRGDGKLHRPGRSRRRPGARRRRPDLHRAPRRREAQAALDAKDLLPFLTEGFTTAAMAKVGTSALESRKLGYLLDSDVIVPNKDELLYVAHARRPRRCSTAATAPPRKRRSRWPAATAIATIKGQLVNMRDGGFISAARLPHRVA